MAACVAVVDRDNRPLYVACAHGETAQEAMQWRVHTALDVAEDRLRPSDLRDLYLGLLYSTESHNVYGYVTNTRAKLFAVVAGGGADARDLQVRALLRQLHSLYADAVSSPFYTPGDPIVSPDFDRKVRALVSKPE